MSERLIRRTGELPIHYRLLPSLQRPLMDKFYRQQGTSMRARGDGDYWVAQRDKDGLIVAGLSLNKVPGGYWLTGLFVAPLARGQGLGSQLIDRALATLNGPTWLFCDPQLAPLYQKAGFVAAVELPPMLEQRLQRYQQTKALLAMCRCSKLQPV